MTRWPTLLALLLVGLAAAGVVLLTTGSSDADKLPDDLVTCLAEASNANTAHDIERERRILEHAEGLPGDAKDEAEVQRRLAVIDWRYHHRFEPARKRLLKATKGAVDGAYVTDTWVALARLEQARERYAAAAEAAREALTAAATERERREARIARARAAIGAALAARWSGDALDRKGLRPVFADLHGFVRTESGFLEPSRLLLQAALLLDEGEAALLAWRSYFHVAEGVPTANEVAAAGEDLARLLQGWPEGTATSAQRIELVVALADSRFFTEASLVALDPHAGEVVRRDPEVGAVLIYHTALERIRELSETYYRQTLLGRGARSTLQEGVQRELTAAVREIEGESGVKGSSAAGSFQAVRRFLSERFGAYVNLGTTATYYDLHMGHRVIDETRTIEQYGQRAELRYVALDSLVSNGFQSWAWEGDGQHGGWATANTIYQVRPVFVGLPLRVWRSLHDPDEVREFDQMLARETARDDDRARKDPHAFLPGLRHRILQQGVSGILERLKGEGLSGPGLRARFLAEAEAAVQASAIYAHEGRHAIDKRAGRGGNLEFPAKLSEVAFAPEPRLAVLSVLSGDIGAPTPHGRANLKVMQGLVAWMKKHRGEIEGLDPERPLLPQLDLLTDEQMRAAFRSMDPLAVEARQQPSAN